VKRSAVRFEDEAKLASLRYEREAALRRVKELEAAIDALVTPAGHLLLWCRCSDRLDGVDGRRMCKRLANGAYECPECGAADTL
jgi:hypothetical protein